MTISVSARNTSAAFNKASAALISRGFYAQAIPSTKRIVYLNSNFPEFVCTDAHDIINLFNRELPSHLSIEIGVSPYAQMALPLYAHDHMGRIRKTESCIISSIATPAENLDYADIISRYTLEYGEAVFKSLTGKEAFMYTKAIPVSFEKLNKTLKKMSKKLNLSPVQIASIVDDLEFQELVVIQY